MANTKFSGWRVAVGCFLIMFAVQGALQTFSIFLPAIVNDTGFTTTQISMVSTIACAIAFALNMVIGAMIKKMGVKTVLIIGIVTGSLGYVVAAYVPGLFGIYLGAVMNGVAVGLATIASCSVIVSNWFIRSHGTVLAVVMAGAMIFGITLFPVYGILIENMGWRNAYVILCIMEAAIALFATFFLVIEHPDKKGQKPLGWEEQQKLAAEMANAEGTDISVIRKHRSFYLILIGIVLLGLATNCENFLPSFWQGNGMGQAQSSNYMSIYSGICAVASIILGRIADKLNARVFQAITSICFIAAIILFAVTQTIVPGLVIVLCVIFAFGAKKTTSMIPPIVLRYSFGRKDYAKVAGFGAGMIQLGIAISNPILGSLRDATGDYRIPFFTGAAIALVAFLILQIAMGTSPYKGGTRKA